MKKLDRFLAIGLLFLAQLGFAQNSRVQVIHNSADLAADTVDVWVNNTLLLDNFAFRTASPFVNGPVGTFDVTIQPKTSVDTTNGLFRQSFTLSATDTIIVVANGIVSATGYTPSTPFTLDVFLGAKETSGSATTTDVLVSHGSTDAPTVDVYESSVPAGTIVDDISYPQFAGYLPLVTADYEVEVRNGANSAIVAAYGAPLSSLNLGGAAITVLASGFLDPTQNSNGPAFGLFAATAAGGPLVPLPLDTIPTARVQAIHNSADLAAAKVDVWLNDAPLLDDFEFRTASPFVDLQAGVPFVISVADSASTDTTNALAKYTYTLAEDSTYILVASGIVSPSGYSPATPFNIDVFGSAKEASGGATTTDVLVYHGATDAPIVDVYESSVPAGTIVDDISYSQFAGYLPLVTADYEVEVRNAANSVIVASYGAPLSTLNLGGAAITVLASGFLDPTQNSNGAGFGLFAATAAGGPLVALPVDTIPTARVQAIHNSADQAASVVDVWLNDAPLLNNFEFRTASPFVDVQAGVPFVISIADSASTDTASALAQYTFTLMEDSTYIIVANGIVSPTGYAPATPFNLDVFGSAREISGSATTTDVLVYHGATDAPAVDVEERSVPAGTIVDSILYSEFDGYLSLNTQDYALEVIVNGTTTSAGAFNAPLASLALGGNAITVLASGFVNPAANSNGPAFGLWVALAGGGNLVPLANTTSLDEEFLQLSNSFKMYPNPSKGELTLEFDDETNLPERLLVFDLNGRKVKELTSAMSTLNNFDVSDLSSGTYFIQIVQGENVAMKKLIIQ
jgi:hypothetical protein